MGLGCTVQHDVAQHQVQLAQRGRAALGSQLALPHHNHMPASCLQQGLIAGVALAVAVDFVLPELGVGHWAASVALALVPVPETPVHKDGRAPLPQHDVWPPGQTLDIQPVAETLMP